MGTPSQCTLLTTTFSHSLPEKRRPPWLDPDPKPPDLENARKALLYQHNPNQPHSPDKLRAERLGLSTRPLHRRSLTAPAQMGVERASVDEVRKNIKELKQQRRRQLRKRHLKKWIRTASYFIVLISSPLICALELMLANFLELNSKGLYRSLQNEKLGTFSS